MKHPKLLKDIHIGKIIRAETNKRCLTENMLAEKLNLLKIADEVKFTKWIVRDTFKQESIKINRLIAFSYALSVNFLQIYLQKMPVFGKLQSFEDEVIININDEQMTITPSKKNRTADFIQTIHIGQLLKAEAEKQNISAEFLAEIHCCTKSAIYRMYDNPDINTEVLISMSYTLNYDFIRNIYLPYMCVDENEVIANECIPNFCTIKGNPHAISVITEKKTTIYHKNIVEEVKA
jgi:hypothetical protein